MQLLKFQEPHLLPLDLQISNIERTEKQLVFSTKGKRYAVSLEDYAIQEVAGSNSNEMNFFHLMENLQPI